MSTSFLFVTAQLPADSISQDQVATILNYLAADSLKGRGNYTPELHKSAKFIAEHFQFQGLKIFPGLFSYFQPFTTKGSVQLMKDSNGIFIPEKSLLNVIGVLEGRSKAHEAIIFSAHYDHVGIENREVYNGANDNASGVTALLVLADYFSKRKDNERTIIFCAFSGEELGLFGSSSFVPYLNADSIIAVINIEMIGISSIGKNAFFVTGEDHSDLKKMMGKNLIGKARIKEEPYLRKELFKRSDNYPFALKGIPAHSIMASDDDDPCYHKPCDDTNRIKVENMTNVIKAIATGTETIINGKDTPKRIKVNRIQ